MADQGESSGASGADGAGCLAGVITRPSRRRVEDCRARARARSRVLLIVVEVVKSDANRASHRATCLLNQFIKPMGIECLGCAHGRCPFFAPV